MITRKTIYGFILALCCLYCHQEYASSDNEYDIRVYGFIASGAMMTSTGTAALAKTWESDDGYDLYRGLGLLTLGIAQILFSKQILAGFDTICSKTSEAAEAIKGHIQETKNKKEKPPLPTKK